MQQQTIEENPDKVFYNLNLDAGAMWARRLIDEMVEKELAPPLVIARLRAAHDVAARISVVGTRASVEAHRYPPGAHIDLWLPSGDKRSYSLVGARPHDGAYRIAVRSKCRTRAVAPSTCMRCRSETASKICAAGLALRAALGRARVPADRGRHRRHTDHRDGRAARRGRRSACGCSTRANARGEMAFVFEASTCALLGDRLELHVTDEGTRLEAERAFEDLEDDADVYLCGPYGFQEAIRAAWRDAERPPTNLRFETFAASGAYPNEPFTVHVADYDVDVEVPVNRSMLEALRMAEGVNVMYDCLRGECGLFAVHILEADCQVDHRDVFLSEAERAERKKVCTIVSRALRGGMTVDTGYRGGALRVTTTIVQPAGRAFMETGGE